MRFSIIDVIRRSVKLRSPLKSFVVFLAIGLSYFYSSPLNAQDPAIPGLAYSRPFTSAPDIARIAIIVGGLGLSKAGTQAAIQQLPGEVTLSFSSLSPNLNDWIAEARTAGHEVLLQFPVEEKTLRSRPEIRTPLNGEDNINNLTRLNQLLSRVDGYVGMTNYMTSHFNLSEKSLEETLTNLQGRGLLFVDSLENPELSSSNIADRLGLTNVISDLFIDLEASRISIDSRLLELESIAESGGTAVGIGYPYPVTIERIALWVQKLDKEKIVLAPISAVINRDRIN